MFAELGAAMAGAVTVGLKPTRRGEHLARDVEHSDCRIVVTEPRFAPLLREALAMAPGPTAPLVLVADEDLPGALALIVFTSGTTAGPKGVMRTHGRLVLLSQGAGYMMAGATRDDVV